MRVPTILTFDRITQILYNQYGVIDVSTAKELAGSSTGHVWNVATHSGTSYILKEFTPTFDLDRVEHEPDLVNYLYKKGLPVSEFFPNKVGELTWMLDDRPVNLQSFLQGEPAQQNEVSSELLANSALLLADIQHALSDYPALKVSMDADWFAKRKDTEQRRGKLGRLLAIAEKLTENPYRAQITSDLEWKLSRIEEVGKLNFDPQRFTSGNTHGDYNVGNLLVNGDAIVGAIDFSNARQLPFAWELLRSYTLGSPECKDAVIDLKNLRHYFDTYQEKMKLSEYDLSMAAKLSYFHIVHTAFGYHEYLVDGAENAESLIGYASWNVRLAQWYEAHAEEIVEALTI